MTEVDDKSPLWTKFRDIFDSDPQLWALMQRFTWELIRTGRQRYSSRTVFERIRWHIDVHTSDAEFKINDHWPPYFSRLFMWVNPQYGPSCWRGDTPEQRPWGNRKPRINDGFFELRSVDTNFEIEQRLYAWARGVLFQLKSGPALGCEAMGCIRKDLVQLPGDLWGRDKVRLCNDHAGVAIAYAERHNI